MTTETIEGNVEVAEGNVTPEVEATPPEPVEAPVTEAADPELAEAERLLAAAEAAPTAEAAPAQARSFADLTEDELLADPRVNGLIQRQRMSAAQQAEEKLRRQAASDEAVRAHALQLRQAAENGDIEAYEKSITAALGMNRKFQEDQVTEFFTEGVKNIYQVPPEFHERAVLAREQGDRAGYVTALVDGAVAAKAASLKLSDVPAGSALHAEIEAEVRNRATRAIAAELKAAKIEAQGKVEAPPPAPSGVPTGTSGPRDPRTIPMSEMMQLSPLERGQLWQQWAASKQS